METLSFSFYVTCRGGDRVILGNVNVFGFVECLIN